MCIRFRHRIGGGYKLAFVILRVADGKLAEEWAVNDGWDASIQLGLFDPDHWKESVCGEIKNQ